MSRLLEYHSYFYDITSLLTVEQDILMELQKFFLLCSTWDVNRIELHIISW